MEDGGYSKQRITHNMTVNFQSQGDAKPHTEIDLLFQARKFPLFQNKALFILNLFLFFVFFQLEKILSMPINEPVKFIPGKCYPQQHWAIGFHGDWITVKILEERH